nr:ABATE domain-containing protein [Streptomyces sp. MK5]
MSPGPALGLAATLRARRSTRFQMFVTPEPLNAWYLESGLVDTVTPGREDDVQEAMAVREAVCRLVTDRRLGEGSDQKALDLVDAAARKAPVTPQLTLTGRLTEATPEQASAVVREAVELLSGPDMPLLKECGHLECTRVRIDRSRGMRRQWCGMESCGNRIKAAAYRALTKSAPAAATTNTSSVPPTPS